MRIKWVEIKNFRSIKETSFTVTDAVIALAGGNESGKSNVILALQKFLNSEDFTEEDKYQLTDDEIKITVKFHQFKEDEIERIKTIFNKNDIKEIEIKRVGKNYELISPTIPNNAKQEKIEKKPKIVERQIPENPEVPPGSVEAISAPIIIPPIQPKIKTPKEIFDTELMPLIPNGIIISAVEDLINGHPIVVSELYWTDDEFEKTGNESKKYLKTVRSLLDLAGLTKKDIKEKDINKRLIKIEKGAAKLSKILNDSWQQEDVKVRISSDTRNVVVQFRDGKNIAIGDINDPTKWIWTLPQNRSHGFRWYITFYARYLKEMNQNNSAIFLIDDLGAPLNKKAQEDLLIEFRKLAKEGMTQIIYVTHSKDMVEWDARNSIYCIIKEDGLGTKVSELWWDKYSTEKLPSPLDELGVTWINDFLKQENIILEGITDTLVLNTLARIFQDKIPTQSFKDYILTQGGGTDPSIEMGVLCKVHDRKAFLVFDADTEGLRGKAKATDNDHKLNAEDIKTLANNANHHVVTIEDLLPYDLFLESLNKVGTEIFKKDWIEIKILKKVDTEGLIKATKDRLLSNGLEQLKIDDFIRKYKYDIIQDILLGSLTVSSYTKDEQIVSIVNLFTNLNSKL